MVTTVCRTIIIAWSATSKLKWTPIKSTVYHRPIDHMWAIDHVLIVLLIEYSMLAFLYSLESLLGRRRWAVDRAAYEISKPSIETESIWSRLGIGINMMILQSFGISWTMVAIVFSLESLLGVPGIHCGAVGEPSRSRRGAVDHMLADCIFHFIQPWSIDQ